jgi:PBSX family phage terminase large subunit
MYQDALFTEMPCKMPEFERLCLSIDYGTQNAFAALLWGKIKGIWYAYKGYYYSGRKTGVQKTDTEYLVDLEKTFSDEIARYRSAKEANGKNAYMTTMPRKIETIIDPSAASFIALLEKQDWCSVQKAKNDVLDGIRDTAVAMKTGKIKVYSGIKEWQNEVKGYVWDEKAGEKGDEQPLKINDHYMDATRYFVYTKEIAKVRREYKPLYM